MSTAIYSSQGADAGYTAKCHSEIGVLTKSSLIGRRINQRMWEPTARFSQSLRLFRPVCSIMAGSRPLRAGLSAAPARLASSRRRLHHESRVACAFAEPKGADVQVE